MPDPEQPAHPEMRLSRTEERFEELRGRVGFFAGPALFLALLLVPIPGLSPEAHRTLAVLGLVGVWWLSEALPLAATALVGPALCVLLGVTPAREALRPFADPVIFLFLGGFLLAEAMIKHGLNRRIALTVLAQPRLGDSPTGLLTGFGLLTAFISAWVSNTATAAMMLPIALSILREIGGRDAPPGAWRSHPATIPLILVTAFGASIGGLATPIGTPPNILGIGLIERTLHRRLNFFEWMQFALPAAVVLIGLLIWRLRRLATRTAGNNPWTGGGSGWARAEAKRLGPWTRGQIQVAVVFVLAVTGWILPGFAAAVLEADAPLVHWLGRRLPEGVVALLAAAVLFALPTGEAPRARNLSWADAARIDWGTILLFGGGMAMGDLAFSTGLAEWMGRGLAASLPFTSVLTLTLLFAAIGVAVSEATSNTASASMIIPLAIAVAQASGVDPVKPALGACLGCSLGFMLPVSTPPNALAFATGAVPLVRMIRHGFWLDAVGCVVVVAAVLLLAS